MFEIGPVAGWGLVSDRPSYYGRVVDHFPINALSGLTAQAARKRMLQRRKGD
ncbi:hypothetical protein CCM_05965 [Cordyceps militaris CM01]|uniref:Uncharacterized protein n=1 Tax=Cordyceps militaris (strain CM01) TaxID=983644 RepID=G3JI05_CORMM|nr:uncharacterized protein CCM_05965 [Cordyceps militaris CM01]EGX91808.1 hypothetical protein CCM_05965 [Cordyceps militaris CM01]